MIPLHSRVPHPISGATYLHLLQWFSTTSEQIMHNTVGAEISWCIFLNLYRNYKSPNQAQVAKWKFYKTQGKGTVNTKIPKLNTTRHKREGDLSTRGWGWRLSDTGERHRGDEVRRKKPTQWTGELKYDLNTEIKWNWSKLDIVKLNRESCFHKGVLQSCGCLTLRVVKNLSTKKQTPVLIG